MKGFSIQHVASTPPGWRVRTVKAGTHRVRVAFPPGRAVKGAGIPVQVLHPRGENPHCFKNPGELLLMSANPMRNPTKLELQRTARERAARIRGARLSGRRNNPRHGGQASPYDSLSVNEKLAFGRLGLGKKQLRTDAAIRKARAKVADVNRFRNALPNPSLPGLDAPQAEHARELYSSFHETESNHYIAKEEPHIPAGDYADLGELVALGVKPTGTGQTMQVQEISFPGKKIRVISSANGRQIYFAGDGQELEEQDIAIFTSHDRDHVELGICRWIVYKATKFHAAVPDAARGKNADWQHEFGEDGGYPPKLFYSRSMQRLVLEGGTYHVEGAGIVN